MFLCTQIIKDRRQTVHCVAVGDKLRVESLAFLVGSQIELTQVLAIKDDAGMKLALPTIEGAAVKATIVANGRHEKFRFSSSVAVNTPSRVPVTVRTTQNSRLMNFCLIDF